MSSRKLRIVTLSGILALAFAGACSSNSDGTPASSGNFTGEPVTVMTIAPVDTAAINQPEIMEAARAAVTRLNADGGLGGHEVKLVTCNDGNDTNKAGACARQAVDTKAIAVIGGFTTNGATINPILQSAGIPWVGAPGFSPNELGDKNSFLLLSGAPSFTGIAAKAAQSGCTGVTAVLYDTPTTGKAVALINAGLTAGKAKPAITVKVPTTTTDFSSVAKSAAQQQCAILGLPNDQTVAVAKAGEALGLKTKYFLLSGALNDTVLQQAGKPFEGAVSAQNFVVATDAAWSDAKKSSSKVDWTGPYNENTWAAYRVVNDVLQGKTEVTAATLTAALQAATAETAGGLMAPVDFSKEFGVPGLNRVFNRKVVYTEGKAGHVAQSGSYEDLGPFFGQ